MDIILSVLSEINDFLWTYLVIPMLVGCAIYFTWNLRAIQFTGIGEMFRVLFSSTSTDSDKSRHKKISSFQAFAISLSSRVGTGNLAGVASAIFVGGPGAVFEPVRLLWKLPWHNCFSVQDRTASMADLLIRCNMVCIADGWVFCLLFSSYMDLVWPIRWYRVIPCAMLLVMLSAYLLVGSRMA